MHGLTNSHLSSQSVGNALQRAHQRAATFLLLAALFAANLASAAYPPKFAEQLRLAGDAAAKDVTVHQVGCSLPANVLYPGEPVTFTYQITNRGPQPLVVEAKAELYTYRTQCDLQDSFQLWCSGAERVGTTPVKLNVPPAKLGVIGTNTVDVVVSPKVPATCGGYALVFDIPGRGRVLGSAFVRAPQPAAGRVQSPTYALDINPWRMVPEVFALWKRLGVKGTRTEWGAGPAWQDPKQLAEFERQLKGMWDNDITLMLTVSDGGLKQPLGRHPGRPWLNEKAEMLDTKYDAAALPETDPEFRAWCAMICTRYGWPKGPVNAMELWNEPWEGISISGWGADLPRYREMYTAMAEGVEDARRDAKCEVLIGGTCSSMNTEDKLFCDGRDTFLKWLDFSSIHYQPMCPWPALVPEWANRKSPFGPIRAWDTESWFANTEDRVLVAIATMRASGLERTAGVLHDAVYDVDEFDVKDAGGANRRVRTCHVLSPGAGVTATQAFIGQRRFDRILFPNGLPWVFVFDGLPDPKTNAARPDDGTVVVIGDLAACHDRRMLKFGTVLGLTARQRAARLETEAAKLVAGTPERLALDKQLLTARILDDGRLTLPVAGGAQLFDCLGNEIKPVRGILTVPLNGTGYVLRTNGRKGSMGKLLVALKTAEIAGYEPVEIRVSDLPARVEQKPALRVTLTNVLNRPVSGTLAAAIPGLTIDGAGQAVVLQPHETRTLALTVTGGQPVPSNQYPCTLRFDAGQNGAVEHHETLHANVIAKHAIKVDGDLKDWEGVPPQTVSADAAIERNLTEKAWLPFVQFDAKIGKGVASGYVAYDERSFYFAAKIADDTPYAGGVRFETRDDEPYYYPEVCYDVQKDKTGKEIKRTELRWPAGVRRYTYRRGPDIPSGDGTDNVQIAFGVFAPGENGMIAFPPGTMPGFVSTKVTDYEYALNQVGETWGGGTEIWRLQAPGTPRKHFYPRQPKAERDGGPVKDGQLVMKRDGNTRIVEAALPWSELSDVKKRLDAGQPVRFTFRVNYNNNVAALELNANRSVSRINTYALHDLWAQSWEPQTEFTFEK